MRVRNMRNSKGNIVANQFVIESDKKLVFQSYDSKIVEYHKVNETIRFSNHYDYSRTTSKYLYEFIRSELGIDVNNKKELKEFMVDYKVKINLPTN